MFRILNVMLVSLLVPLFVAVPALAQQLSLDREQYVVGERVKIEANGTHGTGRDRVAIYRASDLTHEAPLYWQYMQSGQNPASTGPTEAMLTFLPLSLPAGGYEARLFLNDGTNPSDSVRFDVVQAEPAEPPEPQGNLTVLCFNIWVQGSKGHGGLDEIVRVIVSTGADIIALQECSPETLDTILTSLRSNTHYAQAQASGVAGIISRFPITATYAEPTLRGYGVRVTLPASLSPARESIRIFNSHLSPYPYGPYELRDGATTAKVLEIEEATRAAEMREILTKIIQPSSMDSHLTTVLLGDHNSPSHLDWTGDNTDQNFGATIQWPVSTMLYGFGFEDSYRTVHPDPITHRGFTWSPGYPKHSLDLRDVHDRIDMVYHRPQAGHTLRAVQAYTIDRDPWPSDHRAVVVSYLYSGHSPQKNSR